MTEEDGPSLMKNSGSDDSRLEQIRIAIDKIDKEILLKLNERASLAKQVGELKQKWADNKKVVFYRPEREANILKAIIDKNEGSLPNEAVAQVFRQIISACRAQESPMRIAFLGPEGTFTQEAALKHFGSSVSSEPMETIDDVFSIVSSKNCDYGVVPIENSTEGIVGNTLDRLLDTKISVCGEIKIKVTHCFLRKGDSKTSVDKIYAHQQALAQCRNWLNLNYPGVPRFATSSNAEAARLASESISSAAVASKVAGEIYGFEKAVEGVEDEPNNETRFVVLGLESIPLSGSDKTSIIVSTKNEPGALFRILEPFHLHNISLSSIETRPARDGKWSYVFFIDFEGHIDELLVQAAMKELKNRSLSITVLGSYPSALTYE